VRAEPPIEGQQPLTGEAGEARVNQALADIRAHMGNPLLRPEDLARLQGISRRRLDALMIRHTGRTLVASLWAQRLQRAAQLLREPQEAYKSITQITLDVGFSSSSHFARLFKVHSGRTPQQWRRE
jgi:transcriptional regulator GlxA family with amidase domain